jgi:hypothetical protein
VEDIVDAFAVYMTDGEQFDGEKSLEPVYVLNLEVFPTTLSPLS